MSSVLIKGFKNDACAKTFIDWFQGIGEQQQCFEFEERARQDASIEAQFTDTRETYPLKQNSNKQWVLVLQEVNS